MKKNQSRLMSIALIVIVLVILGVIFDEPYMAYQINKHLDNEEMVMFDHAYLAGGDIILSVSLIDATGIVDSYSFYIEEIVVNENCSMGGKDFERFANTSNPYVSPPGYLYGIYSTVGGGLTVNYTEIVSFTLNGDIISIEIIEDVHRNAAGNNADTPTAIAFLCAEG